MVRQAFHRSDHAKTGWRLKGKSGGQPESRLRLVSPFAGVAAGQRLAQVIHVKLRVPCVRLRYVVRIPVSFTTPTLGTGG